MVSRQNETPWIQAMRRLSATCQTSLTHLKFLCAETDFLEKFMPESRVAWGELISIRYVTDNLNSDNASKPTIFRISDINHLMHGVVHQEEMVHWGGGGAAYETGAQYHDLTGLY